MEDILRSIRAFLYERSVSPLAGAFVVAWLVWNFRILVILFSGEHFDYKFAAIDEYFLIATPWKIEWLDQYLGRILSGLLIPSLFAFSYIYLYPFLAAPVYEFTLSRRQKLRRIKQDAEDQRLLSVEESRELHRQIAELQQGYDTDSENWAKQRGSLTQTISELEQQLAARPANQVIAIGPNEDETEIDEFDSLLARQVEEMGESEFTITDLFGRERWQKFSRDQRQALGKRFKAKVDRGDFVGVIFKGRNRNNVAVYTKAVTSSRTDKFAGPTLTDEEIKVLQMFAGLAAGSGITASIISSELGIHIEKSRLLLDDLDAKSCIDVFGETEDQEQLYRLLRQGRRILVDQNLIPDNEENEVEKISQISKSELEDYKAAITRYGLKESDFQMDEVIDPTEPGGIQPLTGSLTISYRPTGQSRQYTTGHQSTWPALFETHLSRGAFQNK